MPSHSSRGVTRFSVSLPPSLVKSFDEAWNNMGYDSRSKAVHDALRSFISEHEWMHEETGQVTGVIILLYYMDKPGLLNRIMQVQHKHDDIISSTMHIHLTKDKCLEIIAVKGQATHIKDLAQALMTKRGVKQLKLAAMAL